MNAIHPDLAPLARAAEIFSKVFRTTGKVSEPDLASALLEPVRTTVLRAGQIAEIDLGGPLYHRVSNRTQGPLVTLHVYGVAADVLTTGINRIYAEE